jgi:hypothetical protein
MDEKTKKKRVEKPSIRKKKDLNSVSAKPAATKKRAKKQPKLTALKRTEQSQGHLKPTFEQIRLRAYFISEQRRNAGIAGDEHGDWLRAENELRSELLAEKDSLTNDGGGRTKAESTVIRKHDDRSVGKSRRQGAIEPIDHSQAS